MTTTIIKIKGRSKIARLLVDMAEELAKKDKSIEVSSDEMPNHATLQAIADAHKGKTIKCDSFEDYIDKVK
ncbi:MAG TPA: hypothetical protein VGK38_13155 [Prolixibacteraceae bacterium]